MQASRDGCKCTAWKSVTLPITRVPGIGSTARPTNDILNRAGITARHAPALVTTRPTSEDATTAYEEWAMYANLISLVGQFLTPDVIGKIAQACGISDRTIMQKAVGAAVPALFSGLANLASKPDGARQLADVVASQPPSLLDSLTSASSGAGQLADRGKTALTSLFGRSAVGNIAGALGRYAGLGEGTTASLLSMLAPVALGVLGREAGAGAASGLAQLLTSQKDSFAAAMPKDVRDLLNTGGMFDTAAAAAAPAAS